MGRTGKAERDAAFTACVEQATPSLLRTAWLLIGEHDAAHDLVQAALVRTYVAWPRVRPETAMAYARRILVSERTDRWRRHGAELAVATPSDTPTANVSTTEDRDVVVSLLATLPDRQRQVVVLRYYSVMVAPGATLVTTDSRPLFGGSGVAVLATVEAPDRSTRWSLGSTGRPTVATPAGAIPAGAIPAGTMPGSGPGDAAQPWGGAAGPGQLRSGTGVGRPGCSPPRSAR